MDNEWYMYSFKVLPCSKRYVHDWSKCPYAHYREVAARRSPQQYLYWPEPCPDSSKDISKCPRGTACPYSHSVFEQWLHPAKYRTQMCSIGPTCKRTVCFFAHHISELRRSTFPPLPDHLAPPDPQHPAASAPAPAATALTPPTAAGALEQPVPNAERQLEQEQRQQQQQWNWQHQQHQQQHPQHWQQQLTLPSAANVGAGGPMLPNELALPASGADGMQGPQHRPAHARLAPSRYQVGVQQPQQQVAAMLTSSAYESNWPSSFPAAAALGLGQSAAWAPQLAGNQQIAPPLQVPSITGHWVGNPALGAVGGQAPAAGSRGAAPPPPQPVHLALQPGPLRMATSLGMVSPGPGWGGMGTTPGVVGHLTAAGPQPEGLGAPGAVMMAPAQGGQQVFWVSNQQQPLQLQLQHHQQVLLCGAPQESLLQALDVVPAQQLHAPAGDVSVQPYMLQQLPPGAACIQGPSSSAMLVHSIAASQGQPAASVFGDGHLWGGFN